VNVISLKKIGNIVLIGVSIGWILGFLTFIVPDQAWATDEEDQEALEAEVSSEVPTGDERLEAISFDKLPPEAIYQVMNHLEVRDLFQMMSTSRNNYNIGRDHANWKNILFCSVYQKNCRSVEEIGEAFQELNDVQGDREWSWKDLVLLVRKLEISQAEVFQKHRKEIEEPSVCWQLAKSLTYSSVSLGLSTVGYTLFVPAASTMLVTGVSLFNPFNLLFPPLYLLEGAACFCSGFTAASGLFIFTGGELVSDYQKEIAIQERNEQFVQFKRVTLVEFEKKFGKLPDLQVIAKVCKRIDFKQLH
jgi:hypothetical protein